MTTPITLVQAQAQLAALMLAQAGNTLTVRFTQGGADRLITYRSVDELKAQINYWVGIINGLQRNAAGLHRVGVSLADFTRCG